MERVANLLERQISSVKSQSAAAAEEGPSERLLTSPSLDSMGGVRSPESATPSTLEPWQPHEILTVSDLSHDLEGEQVSSPFEAAAQTPLEETEAVIVTHGRKFHALTRPGNHRIALAMNTVNGPEAVKQWRNHATVLLVWLVAGLVSCLMSLRWFPLGMWAGLLACIGASFAVCGSFGNMNISLNLQVTRILAILAGVLDASAVVLWVVFLARLPCPASLREEDRCSLFRSAMGAMVAWHSLQLLMAGFVAARATRVKALIDPIVRRNMIVLRTARSTPA